MGLFLAYKGHTNSLKAGTLPLPGLRKNPERITDIKKASIAGLVHIIRLLFSLSWLLTLAARSCLILAPVDPFDQTYSVPTHEETGKPPQL